MVPLPGKSAEGLPERTHWQPERLKDSSDHAVFYHDVPPEPLTRPSAAAGANRTRPAGNRGRSRRGRTSTTRFVLCRKDRFFPARWLRPLVSDRLGIEPTEIDSGHCPALSRPTELAGLLDRYSSETAGS